MLVVLCQVVLFLVHTGYRGPCFQAFFQNCRDLEKKIRNSSFVQPAFKFILNLLCLSCVLISEL